MASIGDQLRQVFDDSVPRELQRDLVRSFFSQYKAADEYCKRNYPPSEAQYLRGHKRRADVEMEIRSVCERYVGIGASASAQLNSHRNAFHSTLTCGRIRLTQSRVRNPYTVVRPSSFREEYAEESQLAFPWGRRAPRKPDGLFYAILLHGNNKQDNSRPAFVHVVFPDKPCKSYLTRIDLLERFPEVVAEYAAAPQQALEEEPTITVRQQKQQKTG